MAAFQKSANYIFQPRKAIKDIQSQNTDRIIVNMFVCWRVGWYVGGCGLFKTTVSSQIVMKFQNFSELVVKDCGVS